MDVHEALELHVPESSSLYGSWLGSTTTVGLSSETTGGREGEALLSAGSGNQTWQQALDVLYLHTRLTIISGDAPGLLRIAMISGELMRSTHLSSSG